MMKLARLTLLVVLVTPLLNESLALAPECGTGSGPVPPPPPWGGPGDTLSPGGPGGGDRRPSAPGSGGPSTPAPAGPSAPSAPGGGPSTPGRGNLIDLSDWSWWWNFNRDPYLQLKQSVLSQGVQTSGDEFFLGRGQHTSLTSRLPDPETLEQVVGPALLEAIETGTSRMQGDAMIAIAKLHPVFRPEGKSLVKLIRQHLWDPNQKTAESAVVALGLMGDPANIRLLADLASDNEVGRKAMNRAQVPGRTRPLAALALGILGSRVENPDARRMIVSRLGSLLREDEGAFPDLHVACVTAMGMTVLSAAGVPMDSEESHAASPMAHREAQVHFLLTCLENHERHEAVRAHVPKALATLAKGASKGLRDHVKRVLLEELERLARRDRLVRYGIVQALGQLGDADADAIDVELREALHASVRDGDNNQRGLSLIAIALVSSRRGESAEPFTALHSEREYLLKQLVRGKSRLRPWTALALGLQGYHADREGLDPSKVVVDALLERYEDTRSPADAGAYSIALGLLRDPRALEHIQVRLNDTGNDDARGFAAEGLGLLGSPLGIEPLHELVADATRHRAPLYQAAIGLALLGDKSVVETLSNNLSKGTSAEIKSAQAIAIGNVGDSRAIKPLVKVLEDPRQLDEPRALAATSLGIVCEQGSLPWTAGFANHVNYFAMTETLLNGKATGLLNLR